MPHKHSFPPPFPLVELLWYYEKRSATPSERKVMPDGCISLVINLFEDRNTACNDPDDMNKVRDQRLQRQRPHTKCFCLFRYPARRHTLSPVGGSSSSLKLPKRTAPTSMWDSMILWDASQANCANSVLAAPTAAEKLRIVEVALLERAAGYA